MRVYELEAGAGADAGAAVALPLPLPLPLPLLPIPPLALPLSPPEPLPLLPLQKLLHCACWGLNVHAQIDSKLQRHLGLGNFLKLCCNIDGHSVS